MPTDTVGLDAVFSQAPNSILIDAYIIDNGLSRHFRDRDHVGIMYDTAVVLDQDIGPWPAGTTLRHILMDIWSWVEARL